MQFCLLADTCIRELLYHICLGRKWTNNNHGPIVLILRYYKLVYKYNKIIKRYATKGYESGDLFGLNKDINYTI